MRPHGVMLVVSTLCACATWLTFAAETTKKKEEEKTSSKSRTTKTAPAPKPSSSKAKSDPAPKPAPPAEKKPTPSPAKEPAPKPKEATSKPQEAPPTEKPKSDTKDAAPKDVTSTNKASSRDMEGKDHGEFDHHDAEEEAKEKAAAAAANKGKGGVATTTTSSDMAGWELVRYHERDYVTANSIHKFYRFNNLEVDGNNVWFRSPVLIMKATVGSQDLLINNIKFVLSDPVLELNGKACFSRLDLCKLIDPVLRPSYINSGTVFDTVILDPGHGGHDSGAKGIYGYEKDFTLKLAFAVKAELEKRGLKVVMTRTNDTFISLGGRVVFANKYANSIYVSLHFNSGGSAATGIETFAFTPQGASSVYGTRAVDAYSFNGNERDSENIALATAIHASVVHHFKFVDRGVKRARWYVLKGLERPGVLFEGGFLTNPNDAKFIAAENFRTELAATLSQAIMNYRRAVQPKPAPGR